MSTHSNTLFKSNHPLNIRKVSSIEMNKVEQSILDEKKKQPRPPTKTELFLTNLRSLQIGEALEFEAENSFNIKRYEKLTGYTFKSYKRPNQSNPNSKLRYIKRIK